MHGLSGMMRVAAVGRACRSDVPGVGADNAIDIGQHAAITGGAGRRNGAAASAGQPANVGRVSVGTDHQVDLVGLSVDAGDRRTGKVAFATVDVGRCAALQAAFVHQHDDRPDTLRQQAVSRIWPGSATR